MSIIYSIHYRLAEWSAAVNTCQPELKAERFASPFEQLLISHQGHNLLLVLHLAMTFPDQYGFRDE